MSQGSPGRSAHGGGNKDLGLRIVSALILVILALAVTLLGGFAFRLFAAILAALVFHEWTAMHPPASHVQRTVAQTALAVALAAMLAGLSAPLSFAAVAVAFLVVLLSSVIAGGGAWSAYGIAYAGVPAAALAHMRGADVAGLMTIFFLYATVWATDVLAYFTGRKFGGPKLAPFISPGKTWSGAIGGAIGGVLAGLAMARLAGVTSPLFPLLLLAFLLSVISQAGDLFESAMKRRHGVKDSGALIPGHGGVMDRVDGLVAAAVALYLIGVFFSGLTAPAAFFSR